MKPHRPKNFYLILILGVLTALCPFSIDMYLPAFPKMAADLGIPVARLSLSLSSFFIGLAIGQLFYGPLLDRFGRKKPLYAGLAIYIVATIGCLISRSVEGFVVLRFLQAIGGCAANVAAMAMVSDFFSAKESAKVFSLLVLILGSSPLLAPTVGSYLSAAFGWASIFILLAVIAALLLAITIFYLPEGHAPDHSHSLHPERVFKSYLSVLKEPQFYTYSLAGAFAFAGLFVYLAASPMIFMEIFHLSPKAYGGIFTVIAAGFIGASQCNFLLLRRYSNEQIVRGGLASFMLVSLFFLSGTLKYGTLPISLTILIFFLTLAAAGITSPNASALALVPFAKKAGTAAALIGFLQMGVGSLASIGVGLLKTQSILPIALLFFAAAFLALLMLAIGHYRIKERVLNLETFPSNLPS
jgi:DHA1 family bicyclomycin/chloramphenicol resistance-like MFS transporter